MKIGRRKKGSNALSSAEAVMGMGKRQAPNTRHLTVNLRGISFYSCLSDVRKIINEISTPSPKRMRSDKPNENLNQSTAIMSTPLSVSSLTARANQPSTSTDKKQKVRKVKKWKPHHKHKTKRAGNKLTNMGKVSSAFKSKYLKQ